MIGSRLAHYLITKKLGEGGMGVVYQARDERLGREVALKILPPNLLSDSSARSRLLREAQLASTLNHPNICTIHGLEEAAGQYFIVMEFVKGQELRGITPAGGLSAQKVARYGAQAAGALAHAHAHAVVHRDLKSSNVMITPDDRVKVLDFGLAKRQGEEEDRAETRTGLSLTGKGAVVGTPYAMAPEVLKGAAPDTKSDIWGLGVVLYEMAAGAQPFAGRTGFELSDAILREPPLPLPQSLPAGIRGVILRCLEKEPQQRYQSPGEVQAALEALLSTESAVQPVEHRSKGLRYVIAAVVGAALIAATVLAVLRGSKRAAPTEYEQLTNFEGSVTSPALSSDGRILAFLRGDEAFYGRGQVWVKLLPNGEPVQLTNDTLLKMSPKFSPDSSRVAYTGTHEWAWDTWTVPVMGGAPQLLLPNASGLTWIGKQQVMFSEIVSGLYMKVVTASESRAGERDVYLPSEVEIGMAHRSYLSPDGKWVLVAEMDNRGWLPCRLVSFEKVSAGSQVGPASAKCTEAAWSPDGRWMFFAADASSGFHLWRQRFPDGEVEQITFGATEEEGIALEPDGKSLITGIGVHRSSIFLQQPSGERQVTAQGYAYSPAISPDGTKVYYLERSGGSRAFVTGELWGTDLASGHSEKILPGFSVTRYDVSADGKRIAFAAADAEGKSYLWLASLTRSFPPLQLTKTESYRPFFGMHGTIFFVGKEGADDYLERINDDGTGLARVVDKPVIYLLGVSPDAKWLVAWIELKGAESPNAVVLYPADGGEARMLCHKCSATGPAYEGASIVNWSPDGRYFYLRMELPGMTADSTRVIPIPPGRSLPVLPARGIESIQDVLAIPGVRSIPYRDVFPGRDPSVYAFIRRTTQRNLYRVRLP
jgi:serine/threonine protein kinase/Tol biopolymer transport system component